MENYAEKIKQLVKDQLNTLATKGHAEAKKEDKDAQPQDSPRSKESASQFQVTSSEDFPAE